MVKKFSEFSGVIGSTYSNIRELFNGNSISSAILNDLYSVTLSQISKLKSKFLAVYISGEHEICEDFVDSVDFILNKHRVKNLGKKVNMSDYYHIDLDSFSEYGYKGVYIGTKVRGEIHVFVKDISNVKNFWSKKTNTYIVGTIKMIKKDESET